SYRQTCLHRPTLFPYTTLFRSVIRVDSQVGIALKSVRHRTAHSTRRGPRLCAQDGVPGGVYHGGRAESIQRNLGTRRPDRRRIRSEEHTSELQSRENLVCRLLL